MATITDPYTWVDGDPITAATQNTRFAALYTAINGNLDNANIKSSAGIAFSKLDRTSELLVLRALSNLCLSAGVTGDTVARVSLSSSGNLQFGAGGASAQDLMIKRSNANTLALRDAGDTADKNLTLGALTASGNSTFGGTLGVTGALSLTVPLAVSSGGFGANLTIAKGTIAIGSTSSAYGALPVGTDNYVLTADSAQPLGVKWAAGGGVGTTGDLEYYSATNTKSNRAIGTTGHVLTVVAGVPNWAAPTIFFAYSSKSANFNAAVQNAYGVDTSGGAVVCTLPTAVGVAGQEIVVSLRTAGNSLTFNTTSSQTIDGQASGAISTSVRYNTYRFMSDGANWIMQ